jgi:hypothetical protein
VVWERREEDLDPPDDESKWSEEDEEEEWDPTHPDDPDFDLSEAAGYAGYDSSRQFPSRTLVVIVSVLLVAAMLAPFVLRLLR